MVQTCKLSSLGYIMRNKFLTNNTWLSLSCELDIVYIDYDISLLRHPKYDNVDLIYLLLVLHIALLLAEKKTNVRNHIARVRLKSTNTYKLPIFFIINTIFFLQKQYPDAVSHIHIYDFDIKYLSFIRKLKKLIDPVTIQKVELYTTCNQVLYLT